MSKYYFSMLFIFFTSLASAESVVPNLVLSKAPVNLSDVESIKRGAKIFASTCMVCHTAIYLRYDKLAHDAGVIYEKMPTQVKTWPFGIAPPDLSLEASYRGVDWIYTYLHSFYKDPSRPTGANNLLNQNSAMLPVLTPFQGEQVFVPSSTTDLFGHTTWYDNLVLVKQGSMSPEQFDSMVTDIVNFLAYAAEPYHEEQRQIGYGVLLFLTLFAVLTYLLKREYWKDVKKYKKDK